ncbi:MAG: hypothetical protein ACLFVQ_07940 [Chitinispirillaceae bacterium]
MIREVGKSLFPRLSKARRTPQKEPSDFKSMLRKLANETKGNPDGDSESYIDNPVAKHRGFKFPQEDFSLSESVNIGSAANRHDPTDYTLKGTAPVEDKLAAENSDASQSVMSEDTALKIAGMIKQKLLSEGAKAAFGRFNEISRTNAMVLLE